MIPGTGDWRARLASLQTAPVRDLAFLLTSPPPWHTGMAIPEGLLLGSQGWPQLQALDACPQPLLDWLAVRPTRRLGVYAESLLGFWFHHAPHLSLQAANLPVREQGRSIGEFDFLLRHAGQAWHLEAASKYYLYLPAQALWVGPSLRDAWWLKYRKLNQQLALSRHPAANLPSGFEHCRAASLVTGWLFLPANTADTLQPPFNTDALCGWWCAHTAPWPQLAGDSRWAVLPRLRWLAPACLPEAETLSLDDCRRAVQGLEAPRLVVELQPAGEHWVEVARGFVVPPDWPSDELLSALRQKLAA